MNWMVMVGEGVIWFWLLFGAPKTHGMVVLSLVIHVHGMGLHVHLRSRSGNVV